MTDVITFKQDMRDALFAIGVPTESPRQAFRKTSRILAIQIAHPFVVETDRGPMTGQPGDWLVTNHPDDDPNSDLWSISDERMKATYEEVLA